MMWIAIAVIYVIGAGLWSALATEIMYHRDLGPVDGSIALASAVVAGALWPAWIWIAPVLYFGRALRTHSQP